MGFYIYIFLFFFCFFFKFSRYMFTLLRNHLNFQNAFVLDKYQHDVYFCTYFRGPKNIIENIWDYVWFWKKGKYWRILCVVVLWAKVVLKMLFTCNNNKEKCDMNTGKHMILLHKKSSLTEEVLFKSIKQKTIRRQVSRYMLQAWLGSGFVFTLGASSNSIHPSLINCKSFLLKALQEWMICPVIPAWYSQLSSDLYQLG